MSHIWPRPGGYGLKYVTHVVSVGEGDIWVRGARGEDGLVEMRQLIVSIGMVWIEVCSLTQRNKGLLPQVRDFLYFNFIATHM